MKPIIWIDLETTGLDMTGEPKQGGSYTKVLDAHYGKPDHVQCRPPDRILEVAVIVTDGQLRELARDSWVTSEAHYYDIKEVSSEVREMHSRNGLWVESLASPFSLGAVDEACAQLIERAGAKGSIIAGNTIRFDREFLRKWMPRTFADLHYRDLNVSTLNELAERFWPEVHKGRPQGAAHRAMPDVLSSIAQLRYYLDRLLPLGAQGGCTKTAPDGAVVTSETDKLQTAAHK
jgi:oligoribonuclease